MIMWTASFQLAQILSELEARGSGKHDAPLEWRAPSNESKKLCLVNRSRKAGEESGGDKDLRDLSERFASVVKRSGIFAAAPNALSALGFSHSLPSGS